jgi:quinol monooxygenase YgiN
MIYLNAHLRTRPGDHPELMKAAKAMIAATRQEAGCIRYDLHVSVTDPQSMVFVEEWKDRAALEAHFSAPHMAVWRKASEGYFIDRRIDIIHPEKVETL